MKTYSIQYKSLVNPTAFKLRIEKFEKHIQIFDNTYVIETDLKAKEIWEYVSVGNEECTILVFELSKSSYYGRMPTNFWDWLTGNVK
jgi:hypothetical protein